MPGQGVFDHLYFDSLGERLDYFDTYYVDGSVMRFRRLVPPSGPAGAVHAKFQDLDFWVSEWHVDAYDNKTLFEHDYLGRVQRIRHPDGVDELYNYAPTHLIGSGGWSPAVYSGVEVSFSAPGAAASDLSGWNTFYLFKRVGQFRPFAGDQLYRVYSAKMPMLTGIGASGLYDLPADLVGASRYQVTQFVYSSAGLLTDTEHILADSLLPGLVETIPAPVLHYVYKEEPASSGIYRVASETHVPSGHTWEAFYLVAANNSKLVTYSRWTCSETGTEVETYFDTWRRPTAVVTTVRNDATGRPRSVDADAAGGVEPLYSRVNYQYGTCGNCLAKPTEVEHLPSGRKWTWDYGATTGLVMSMTYPSPSGTGVASENFVWQPLVAGEIYKGYRLDSQTDAAGRVWNTTYNQDVVRVEPAHGVKARHVQTSSPPVASAVPSGPVETSTYFVVGAPFLQDHLGWHQVRETGQVDEHVDGDGVRVKYDYNDRGLIEAVTRGVGAAANQQVRTQFAYDAYGRPNEVKDLVGSTKAQTLLIDYNSAGRVIRTRATIGGQQLEERLLYDQFGNLAVRLRKNLDAAGGSPATLKGAATSAREWLRDEWHYSFDRLITAFEDRRPLNEGDSGALADAPDARFLRTDLVWLPRGLVSSIGLPNGAAVDLTYDGYGTLYKRVLRGTAGEELTSRSFINNALEPVRLIEGVGPSKLVTTIDRNSSGVVEVIHEPAVAHPGGLYPATFGVKFARHEFDTDILGQTIEARVVDETNSALMRKVQSFYDVLGRVYKVEIPDVLGTYPTAVQEVTWTGASKATKVTDSAGRFVQRTFDALGRITQVEDSRTVKPNKVIYEFLDNTDFVARTKTNNFDEVAGAYVERVTDYTYDTLGRVTQIAVGATSPLVSQYTYFATGDVQTFTDPSGKVERFLPDALGRLTQRLLPSTDPAKSIWNGSTHQDFAGNATSRLIQEDGEGRLTTSIMDFAGRLRAIAEPGSTVMPTAATPNQPYAKYFVYDGASRLSRMHTGQDGVIDFVRDGAGRVLSRVRGWNPSLAPESHKVSVYWGADLLEWDALGRPTQAVGMMGVAPLLTPYIAEQFTYDGLGRKTAEKFSDLFAGLNQVESKYVGADPFRRQVNYLHGAGGSADDLFMETTPTTNGRLGSIGWATSSSGTKTQLAQYSHEGGAIRKRRTFIPTFPYFDTTYSYDVYGRMASIAQSFNVDAGVTFHYDTASNLIGEEYKKQKDSLAAGDRFAYDEHHRLARAWLDSHSMSADPDTVAFHKKITYGMDEANNRTSVAEKLGQAGTETVTTYTPDAGSTAVSPNNRYVDVGGVKALYDSSGNLAFDGRFYYVYDANKRVAEVLEATQSSSNSMAMSSSWGNEFEESGGYGASGMEAGPVVPMTPQGLDALEAARAAMMARIGANQTALLQRATDPTLAGEAVEPIVLAPEVSGPEGGGMAMSSSSLQSSSQPVLELRAIYIYDAFNRRVGRFVNQVSYFNYVWDGWQEAEELSNTVVTGQYVWGEQLDELVAYRHKANPANGVWASYYVAEGGAHCPSRILNSSGQVVEIQEYDPYGKTSLFDGSGASIPISGVGNPFGWKGHRVDVETRLVYMRNRYYHTGWGRFMTQDLLGVWGDHACSGNAYVYCANRPLTHRDPMGLQTIAIVFEPQRSAGWWDVVATHLAEAYMRDAAADDPRGGIFLKLGDKEGQRVVKDVEYEAQHDQSVSWRPDISLLVAGHGHIDPRDGIGVSADFISQQDTLEAWILQLVSEKANGMPLEEAVGRVWVCICHSGWCRRRYGETGSQWRLRSSGNPAVFLARTLGLPVTGSTSVVLPVFGQWMDGDWVQVDHNGQTDPPRSSEIGTPMQDVFKSPWGRK